MDATTTFRELYRTTIPSVVSIYITPEVDGGMIHGGAGSGFIFDERGYVVTNAHVVRDTSDVDLRFSEGDWRTGTIVGTDVYTDLAAIYVDDLPEYADSLPIARANPVPGEHVAAFGNPMGLDGTMTTGVVSGTSRSTPTGNGFAIPDTIQTDAAINPGNSGGPLVTQNGRVVGVNRAKGGDNIGFAISAAIVNRVVPALIDDGRYRHSYLQIRTIDVSPAVADANGLDEPGGVLVVEVGPGPARAELMPSSDRREIRGREIPVGGDVIVGIDGRPIDSHEALTRYLVTETEPDDVIEVEIVRGGSSTTRPIKLAERPSPKRPRRSRRLPIRG